MMMRLLRAGFLAAVGLLVAVASSAAAELSLSLSWRAPGVPWVVLISGKVSRSAVR